MTRLDEIKELKNEQQICSELRNLSKIEKIYSGEFNDLDKRIDRLIDLLPENKRDFYFNLRDRIYREKEEKGKVVCVVSQNQENGKVGKVYERLMKNGKVVCEVSGIGGRHLSEDYNGHDGHNEEPKTRVKVFKCHANIRSREFSEISENFFHEGGDI